MSSKFIFYKESGYFKVSLKRRQLFFCLLNPDLKLFKFFSSGYLMKFFKKKKKKDKYSFKTQASLLFFFKKYFNFFFKKKLIMIFSTYKRRHLKILIEIFTLFKKNFNNIYFLPKENKFTYKFRRVKAVKRKIRRKLN